MDINKIKQKLEAFQNASMLKSNLVWKAPAGKSQIRLIEYKHDKDNPFVELYFHFNIQKGKPILSPTSYGEADPIVEFANKLRKTGSKEDFLLARKLEPKMRVFAPVVVRGLEAEGVKVWGFGKTVANEILSFIVDPDYGNIADTMNGRDIAVEVITPAEAGNQFGKTTIRVKPNKSQLHENAEFVKKFLENQPNIMELYTKHTYDELKEVLKNYLEPSADTEQQTQKAADATTESKVAPSVTIKSKTSKVEDVNAAFDDIFNN